METFSTYGSAAPPGPDSWSSATASSTNSQTVSFVWSTGTSGTTPDTLYASTTHTRSTSYSRSTPNEIATSTYTAVGETTTTTTQDAAQSVEVYTRTYGSPVAIPVATTATTSVETTTTGGTTTSTQDTTTESVVVTTTKSTSTASSNITSSATGSVSTPVTYTAVGLRAVQTEWRTETRWSQTGGQAPFSTLSTYETTFSGTSLASQKVLRDTIYLVNRSTDFYLNEIKYDSEYNRSHVLFYLTQTVDFGQASTGKFTNFFGSDTSAVVTVSQPSVYSTNIRSTNSVTNTIFNTSTRTHIETYLSGVFSDSIFEEGFSGYITATTEITNVDAFTTTSSLSFTSTLTSNLSATTSSNVGFPNIFWTNQNPIGTFADMWHTRPVVSGYVGFGGNFSLGVPVYETITFGLISGTEPPDSTIIVDDLTTLVPAALVSVGLTAFPVSTGTGWNSEMHSNQNAEYISDLASVGTATLAVTHTGTTSIGTNTSTTIFPCTYTLAASSENSSQYISTQGLLEPDGQWPAVGINYRQTGAGGGKNRFDSPWTVAINQPFVTYTLIGESGETGSTGSTENTLGRVTFTIPGTNAIRYVGEALFSACHATLDDVTAFSSALYQPFGYETDTL